MINDKTANQQEYNIKHQQGKIKPNLHIHRQVIEAILLIKNYFKSQLCHDFASRTKQTFYCHQKQICCKVENIKLLRYQEITCV